MNNDPWDTESEKLITYCKHCHSLVEGKKKYPHIELIKVFKEPSLDKNFIDLYVVCSKNKINHIAIFKYDSIEDCLTSIGIISNKTFKKICKFNNG